MKFSKLAREIYGRYTDQIEPYGMDECWLDVTGSGCMGTGFEIADEIRRTVKFELGLTISAGVSFNKIFAKLGSDMKKPDAITCIEADSFREKIWCLPASDLLGVGRATEKVLSGYGIHTIGELAATSDDFLKCRLGKNGLVIKKYANGLDDSPVMRSDYVSPVKSIGHGITTMQDLENNAEVWCVMLELVQGEGGVMPLMAKAAAQSGAVGIRANTVRDITQIKQVVDLPVIGIIKKDYPGTPMYITVTMKEVDELVACGVDILAVQGTGALRPDGSTSAQFIRAIKAKYPDQLVMADCDNFENAMACAEAGADFVGTTMRGYTPETKGIDDIDFDFVHKLAAECPAKVIAEGHIHYPEQAVKALEAGAFALVVGGAITRPAEITARFTGAINAAKK